MPNRLCLVDGLGLAYRSHFAFLQRPIRTSKGVNTSALYGFVATLLDLLQKQAPSHLAVTFDTDAPTHRHELFADYKSHREAMPEELAAALPHIRRFCDALHIPSVLLDGWEADDIMGTLATRAEAEGFDTYLVTADKDFAQLVSPHIFLLKPSRTGIGLELHGLEEVKARWGVNDPKQVIDLLGLWGDASDNIPGVPGIGEKTATKLIAEHGTIEGILNHLDTLKGKLKETLESHRDQALLSKKLATIDIHVPIDLPLSSFACVPPDLEALSALCTEFEFNSLGRRLLGPEFKAGRGGPVAQPSQGSLDLGLPESGPPPTSSTQDQAGNTHGSGLRTIRETAHTYQLATTASERAALIALLSSQPSFCFDLETTGLDPKTCRPIGIAFSWQAHHGYYVVLPEAPAERAAVLAEFLAPFHNTQIEKLGHNLKFDLSVLHWQGVEVHGPLFDTMIAHCLIAPELRHGMDYLSEAHLGYSPIPITQLIGDPSGPQQTMDAIPVDQVAEYAAEDADVTWQLGFLLRPLLAQHGQERVYHDVEAPLISVLMEMEQAGVRVDRHTLEDLSVELGKQAQALEASVHALAGNPFNLNSPKQLGEVLFDQLKIAEAPKKTKTGQYSTSEQTLMDLASDHPIVQQLLEFRSVSKLKSTYADALPAAISPVTGRIHTTFHQSLTATGRLNSQNPNLQNIPVRSERGQEIRKAFVPRDPDHKLLSADYSQIELRIIAALSHDPAMQEAFHSGLDIHTATAARVFSVSPDQVTGEMRRRAKMVNFGIIYGISSFGLSQRLAIPKREAAAIIDQYFAQYPNIRRYMEETIATARNRGYVETVTGRRRYLPDLRSANGPVRAAAERNAINTPIQGTAADMIKLAMIQIQRELKRRKLRTQMVLQVHDELLFDLWRPEEAEVRSLVTAGMREALPLEVPIEVEVGAGNDWLEAH